MDTKHISFPSTLLHRYDVNIKSPRIGPGKINNTSTHKIPKLLHRILATTITPQSEDTQHRVMSLIVEENDRGGYGLRMQKVIASNQSKDIFLRHSSHGYPPDKNVSAIHDRKFGIFFDRELRSPLEALLLSSLPDCSWSMNVLHLGFKSNGYDNPMVIHVLIQMPGYFDGKEIAAANLLKDMEEVINKKQETLEKISIDVCQVYVPKLTRSDHGKDDDDDFGVDLSQRFDDLYLSSPPPGFSIGRKNTSTAGSLTGFVKYKDDIYSLTCRHVAFPTSKSQPNRKEYKYKDGGDKLMISMPADDDHEATKLRIETDHDKAAGALKDLQNRQVMASDKDYSYQIETKQDAQRKYDKQLSNARNYKTDAGYIYAAPEEWHKTSTYGGVLDWAIIRNYCTDPKNKLPIVRFPPKSPAGKFIANFHKVVECTNEEKYALTAKYAALNCTNSLEIKQPNSFSEPHDKTVYFKSSTRTSDCKACTMSCIKSIVYKEDHGPSHEHVFVGRRFEDKVSEGGDSGALIYDIDIIPGPGNALNTAALLPMAIIWGGGSSGGIVTGFRDVTFATPVGAVLKDIERYMGWEEGSLRFC
ncbi:hypothetical protein OCU04_012664 [Sclerotinia nivalis]|uniref:Uncharacterized protein n=1 Tax=Sclerotinia nivalis TaxID=352851 RepID=A0A9X0A948_9HELO|nr:hypothetical protein OCU04_012664 [Sclerotinia nivalis]